MTIYTLDLDFLKLRHSIAVFVVEGPEGLVLVETGPHSTFPHLEALLLDKGFRVRDFKQVFLSHIHFDHAGAAWAFAQQGARIYVHPKGLPHLAAPEKLYHSAKMIYGDAMEQLWGVMQPIPEKQLYAPEEGEVFEAAGLRFTAWYTPGHAVHHIAWQVVDPTSGRSVLFTGDVAGVKIDSGIVVPPCPPPDIQVEDWLASIQRMRALDVETLYLTHFGPIHDKNEHLDALEQRLLVWAEWMKPYALAQTPAETIVPAFQDFVKTELAAAGIDAAGQQRYEAANPAFMSVAGLMRYWKKKLSRV